MQWAQNGNAFKALNNSVFYAFRSIIMSWITFSYECILKTLIDANYEKQNVVQIIFWSFYLCV